MSEENNSSGKPPRGAAGRHGTPPERRSTLRLAKGGADGPRAGAGRRQVLERTDATGLAARDLALAMLVDVLDHRRSLDDAIAKAFSSARGLALQPRDRALARLIAATVLRRKGIIEGVLAGFMEKPLAPRYEDAWRIMLAGAAQILYLDTPPHAAVSLAVGQARARPVTQHLAKLVNAILRRVALEGRALLDDAADTLSTFPDWLRTSLVSGYGEEPARAIADASLLEAPLDLTIKEPARIDEWAERLGGVALSTGTVRIAAGGRIEDREGYRDGAWWVQDAAAALPARLLGDDLSGKQIADLCAAPGGKTAQLAARGAHVTAVDISAARLSRVAENLQRLGLAANVVEADVATWQPGRTFDAVLLDAPCSASGTIRRHPDILHLKSDKDIAELIRIQTRLLDRAAELVQPGGTLVYCTCALGKAEGESRIQSFLDRHKDFARHPITAGEAGMNADWITADGALRTLPTGTPGGDPELRGMDGFFAARLKRAQ